jgi:hypothetical protein
LNLSDSTVAVLWLAIGVVWKYSGVWPNAVMTKDQTQLLSRRYRGSPARALELAKRPPVLYLRSFSFDALTTDRRAFKLGRVQFMGAGTVEQGLVGTLGFISPVMALGRPGETDRPPGAVRFYAAHDIWESTIEAAVPLSSLVVWAAGYTPALRWEIEHLLARLPPSRLLMWTPLGIGEVKPEQREREWQRFLVTYGSLFQRPLPLTIGNTTFFAFEDDWTSVALPGVCYPARQGEPPTIRGLHSFVRTRVNKPE